MSTRSLLVFNFLLFVFRWGLGETIGLNSGLVIYLFKSGEGEQLRAWGIEFGWARGG